MSKSKTTVPESPSRLGNYARSQRVNRFEVETNPYLDKVETVKPYMENGLEEVKIIKSDRKFEKPIFVKNDFRIEVMRRNGTLGAITPNEGLVASGCRGEKADVAIENVSQLNSQE